MTSTVDIQNVLEQFSKLPTTVITDVMDRFGTLDAAIKPVWGGAKVCAQAATVLTREGDNLGIHGYLKEAVPGRVVVVSAAGATQRAIIGDLIAERAINANLAGFVIDGAIRDAEGIEESGLPVFARGIVSAGPYKHGPFRLGEDVSVGGVVVHEGDIICGDADGVVVIPLDDAERVLALAQEKLQQETEAREGLIASRF